ncbi:multidrug ABC transporter permease [Streptomyces regensis]|uniref:ABC-2 type transport system permease protein n=2 Tax=Prauserella rugosa TaxID=43354 RepID=A0A660CFU0_9PSEU|nr:multidrug ABC transporter permease [Streptomyces regensis]TWH20727.1 ABC-2 type transport system permease protein [Prauserella rugosa]
MALARTRLTALFLAEAKLIGRNATVAGTATVFPIGMAVLLVVFGRDTLGALGWALPIALQIALMAGMTVYITTTLTLTARREDLYLKRLRTSECADSTIILGLASPVVLLGILQCLLIVGIVWVFGPAVPHNPLILVLAILLLVAMSTVAAIATTGLVSTIQQADMAAMPFFLFLLGTVIWGGMGGADGPDVVQLLTPGGALMDLVRLAYDPAIGWGALSASLPAFGVLAGWTALGAVAATRLFRWDRRV